VATILGISGSLRRGSYNARLLRAAAELAPEGVEIEIGSIAGIPLYNRDVQDTEGFPPAVVELKERLRGADGLLLATPEYNNAIPGVFKNAIDWISRPAEEIPELFGGLPVAQMGAGGISGTRFSQTAWLPVFRVLGLRPWFDTPVYIERAWEVFDDSGELTDEKLRARVAKLIAGFGDFCRAMPRPRPD
jgi:chromate reductase